MGNEARFITHCLCCFVLFRAGLLTLFPWSSSPVCGPSHRRQSCTNSSVSPSQAPLQRVSLPQGADLWEQTAPAWVCHGVMSPASKPAPARDPPSFHGSTDPSRSLLQGWLLTGSWPPLGIHLLWGGDVPWAAVVKTCSGRQLSRTWSSSSPPSSLTSALQSGSSHIGTPLFQLLMHCRFFLPS